MKKTLYIVDDHRMMLKGLKDYLEENTDWKVLVSCSTSSECQSALENAAFQSVTNGESALPEIVIIDVQLVDENGFSLVQKITQKYPSIKCVMYSMYDTIGYVMQAKASGVKGYISKVASEEELVRCLNTVSEGNEYFDKKVETTFKKLERQMPLLTRQEKNILEKLLQEKSNEQISSELFISNHTVENYVSNIYDKLNVKNRIELISDFRK